VSVVIPVAASPRDLIQVLERLPACVDEVLVGPSVEAGFAAARGDCVVALSTEGRFDAAAIARFVDALQAGGARWPQAA
jgi:hypothetical protein